MQQRSVLITDGDTPLGAELVRLFSERGFRVATTTALETARPDSGQADAKAADRPAPALGVVSVPWNRRSPVSARNLLLSAVNALGAIDEALVLDASDVPGAPLHELSAADVEKAFDFSLKPPVFLARELLSYFMKRKEGVLALVSFCARPENDPSPALERAVREGFKGFASSVLSAYPEAGFFVNAFQSIGAGPQEFAPFIEKTLEEKARKISGRWFTCQPKAGFLQGMLSSAVKKT